MQFAREITGGRGEGRRGRRTLKVSVTRTTINLQSKRLDIIPDGGEGTSGRQSRYKTPESGRRLRQPRVGDAGEREGESIANTPGDQFARGDDWNARSGTWIVSHGSAVCRDKIKMPDRVPPYVRAVRCPVSLRPRRVGQGSRYTSDACIHGSTTRSRGVEQAGPRSAAWKEQWW